jgi:hypothetical protein
MTWTAQRIRGTRGAVGAVLSAPLFLLRGSAEGDAVRPLNVTRTGNNFGY